MPVAVPNLKKVALATPGSPDTFSISLNVDCLSNSIRFLSLCILSAVNLKFSARFCTNLDSPNFDSLTFNDALSVKVNGTSLNPFGNDLPSNISLSVNCCSSPLNNKSCAESERGINCCSLIDNSCGEIKTSSLTPSLSNPNLAFSEG